MSEQAPLLKDQGGPPPATAPPVSGPPLYQAAPQPSTAGTTTIITQPVVIASSWHLHDVPISMRCPNCQQDVTTRLEYEPGILTWLLVGLICLFGFWCGCCLIPLFLDGSKDVVHICPHCNYTIGKYSRLS